MFIQKFINSSHLFTVDPNYYCNFPLEFVSISKSPQPWIVSSVFIW